jgi:hypothetical protein
MLNYGTEVAQGAEPVHMKQTARHLTPARSQAEQTYNPKVQGIGNEGHIHLANFHSPLSSHILYLFKG